jgi:hypothetical protein
MKNLGHGSTGTLMVKISTVFSKECLVGSVVDPHCLNADPAF